MSSLITNALSAVLTHCKDNGRDRTWCPIAYRLAEKFPKEESWKAKKEERRKKKEEASGKRRPNGNGGDEEIAMVSIHCKRD